MAVLHASGGGLTGLALLALYNLAFIVRLLLLLLLLLLMVSSDAQTVIPLSWLEAANLRWEDLGGDYEPFTSVGVDVARFGEDRTVLAIRLLSFGGFGARARGLCRGGLGR